MSNLRKGKGNGKVLDPNAVVNVNINAHKREGTDSDTMTNDCHVSSHAHSPYSGNWREVANSKPLKVTRKQKELSLEDMVIV